MSKIVGAAHAVEIPFVFNDDYPGRKVLAISMSSYWAEFAYSGSPGKGRKGGEPEWKSWDKGPGHDKFIVFDTMDVRRYGRME